MRNQPIIYLLIVMSCLLISCSAYKQVPYFQDAELNSVLPIQNYSPLTVQKNDILGINITSLNPEASAIFNNNLTRTNGSNFDVSPINPVLGYLVDQKGNITLPLLGETNVAGMTTSEVQQKILAKASSLLKEANVTVRILNFKVSVLGDVEHPGVFPVTNERLTVTEALALAGDLNITAKRSSLMLIREIDGQRTVIPIDLTSKDTYTSNNYYLKNNDVIYVQPGKTKYAQVSRGFQTGTLIVSALSVIAIVFSTLHK
ncbi:polysaccharide biosynthesis/export family protein [Pedobacter sp.]|uniref:polysaccharide biosynthesis/export family protein n=1 Tax=Pedobacter sp. TaxID=1411316 RepID=UPI003BA982BB